MLNTKRIADIITSPRSEWNTIEAQDGDTFKSCAAYALPLAAIGPVASFIGLSVIGVSVPVYGRVTLPVASGLMTSLVSYLTALLAVFLFAHIVNLLAPRFGAEKNLDQAMKLAAYSHTPVWLAGILLLFPSLGLLGIIAALYGIYLLYLGLPVLMKAGQDKAKAYAGTAVAAAFCVYLIIGAISGAVMGDSTWPTRSSAASSPNSEAVVDEQKAWEQLKALSESMEKSSR